MELREQVILDEEAAVDGLATGGFCDKSKAIKHLFEMGEVGKRASKGLKMRKCRKIFKMALGA